MQTIFQRELKIEFELVMKNLTRICVWRKEHYAVVTRTCEHISVFKKVKDGMRVSFVMESTMQE